MGRSGLVAMREQARSCNVKDRRCVAIRLMTGEESPVARADGVPDADLICSMEMPSNLLKTVAEVTKVGRKSGVF